jgi:Methyltransferase domain
VVKSFLDRVAHHLLFRAQSHPHLTDRWGYHIRPIHYYEPIPDFRAITLEQITRRREFLSIDFNWDNQLALLNDLIAYRDELSALEFNFDNGYFSGFDAAVYYSVIRHLKPQRIIEIGGGYSTQLATKALRANGGGKLTCIEPYPERLNGDIDLIQKRVEEIDVDFFSCLERNDILFIDSSHAVKFGSDVCFEFLQLLPRLAPGVWIHVHDIFFPHDYPAEWLIERRMALNEQYLLEAFLSFNEKFQVALANYWLCLDHADQAARLWPKGGSSLWMKRVA